MSKKSPKCALTGIRVKYHGNKEEGIDSDYRDLETGSTEVRLEEGQSLEVGPGGGASLVAQGLRLHAPSAEGTGSIPGQDTVCCTAQAK